VALHDDRSVGAVSHRVIQQPETYWPAGARAGVDDNTRAAQQAAAPVRTGQQVYETICVTCHGPDGKGGVNLELEKVIELPDFSDCSFRQSRA
jgi:mono/diheme cytochrome c family protein